MNERLNMLLKKVNTTSVYMRNNSILKQIVDREFFIRLDAH